MEEKETLDQIEEVGRSIHVDCGGSGITEQPEGTPGERRSISAGRILCKGEDRRGMPSSRIGIGARRVRLTARLFVNSNNPLIRFGAPLLYVAQRR